MTREEAITLVEYMLVVFPHQRVAEYTPQAWADVFEAQPDLTFAGCRKAVVRVARSQPFVNPSDVIHEAHRASYAEAQKLSALRAEEAWADLGTEVGKLERSALPSPARSPAVRDLIAETKRRLARIAESTRLPE